MEKNVENIYDLLLRNELSCQFPNEDVIRDLVEKGADIAGEFLIDTVFCYTNQDSISSLNIRYFKLLLELGAEVNYVDEGFNCLYEASLSCRPELVALFIDSGANVNCINTDTKKTLLDAIIAMQHAAQMEPGRVRHLSLIANTLKKHGAMRIADMN